jgi:oxepin-CoA hydrolase/3-oxo-5,6-dehydrosuberyl-CoA semialdehyde dehydrogenase
VPRAIESYAAGRWVRPRGDGVTVADANTGEVIATASSEGVDLGEMLAYGRRVGGPALGALSFHERAAALKALAQYLNHRREAYYELSYRAGATLRDCKLDIDGGIGVLFSYSSRARRELPNTAVLVDGEAEPLGKGGHFAAQHIWASRPGVAVQVNAFNFPVWGMLEKFAPAFIAGMPSLVKPATQTAYVAEAVVRDVVASGLLPEGCVQFLCGDASGLFNHLEEHDVVFFTGSASTAHRLRAHPTVLERSVAFNAEADSLNCSILGPDAVAGEPELEMFVDQLVTEMTAKAGQKCTAIRRALVPEPLVGEVVERAVERLKAVRVGHAALREVTMGPLASLAQREEVLRSLKALLGAAERVFGGAEDFEVLGASKERGAFMPPMLLLAPDARRPEPHEVEAFGPVATIIGYGSLDDAARLAALGRGSLVGSVVTNDPDVARRLVLGLAPWHGRLLVLNREDAAESTGHGSPLPNLVHGGPGRAGGGEEMGGLRAIWKHMHRFALQGPPQVLSQVTGRYTSGSPRLTGGVHPFRKYLEDLSIGDAVVAGPRQVTSEDICRFAELTGDKFYAHTDEEAAKKNPFFGGIVAHGYLVLSYAAGLFVDPAPGPVLANYGLRSLRFVNPTYPGDQITVTLTVKQVSPREDAGYGEVAWDAVIANQEGKPVATYELLTLVAKRPRS